MTPVLPGSAIGVLGGGQLGRMLIVEARRMGYRTVVMDPAPDAPAGPVADQHIRARLTDAEAAVSLALASDVVTLEWELVPADVLARLDPGKLRPSADVLRVVQDRLVQKQFLERQGLPQTPFAPVTDPESLDAAVKRLRFPCYLKRRTQGYDGKGQVHLKDPLEAAAAWQALGREPCVMESEAALTGEISVILARGAGGETSFFPVAENVHRDRILHTTRAPALIPARLAAKARELARTIAAALDYCGVMAVEMFVARGGLLVNEIAPRVHNSGHYTLGACAASQFEQHLRAICGLPLADPAPLSPSVMVNLLGDLWRSGEPRWQEALKLPNARLHLYGKAKALPGRKMGHVLLLGEDTQKLLGQAEELLAMLASGPPAAAA